MEYDRNTAFDGFVTLERGVDSGRVPSSLSRNQLSYAVNATMRGGYPEARPGWVKCDLQFNDSTGASDSALASGFEDGQFQGASFYDGGYDAGCIVAAIGGSIYKISPFKDFGVLDITPTASNSNQIEQAWFCQAEEFLIIQDGQSSPIVFDGSGTRRLRPGLDLPVGKAMAYGSGRIWVTLPDGYRFVAGDLVYGSSGTPANGYRDAVLRFTENTFLNEGGYFAVPSNSGGIVGMQFTNNLDSSLGQGPMLVLTPNLICSCQAPVDRTVWKNLEYPIQTIALHGYGALGNRNITNVNGDVFYRADDGIRSFKLARRDFGTWGNTPISAEMNRVLKADSRVELGYGSSVVFDNRLLSTVSPYRVQGHGVPHRGLAVLDFDILSRMHGAQQPAWDGLWTGLNILQILTGLFNGVERCFAFVLNDTDEIELWELTRNYPHDHGDDGDDRIEWSLEFKALDFDSPFDLKQLETGEIWVDKLSGAATVEAYYKPDEYPDWIEWHPGWTEECEEHMLIPATGHLPPTIPDKEHRAKMKLPAPDETADPVEDRSLRQFFTIQPKLNITGRCRLKGLRIKGRAMQEKPQGEYRT